MTDFVLDGSIETRTVVTINYERAFTGAGNKIHLPTTEVLLRTAVGNLYTLKNLCYWAALNAVLLPSFPTKVVVLKGEMA